MTEFLTHTTYLTIRQLRSALRQPVYFVFTLVQPLVWILLFSQLFKGVANLPGFTEGNYITFLAPGIVIFTATFTGAWSGMGYIEDMDRGIMNRMLTTPVNRGALIAGVVGYNVVMSVVSSGILLVVAWIAGAKFDGGVIGILITLLAAALMIATTASLSDALALLTRSAESLMGISQTLTLPMLFLSTAMMPEKLVPSWIQTVSMYNPITWAVDAARSALSANPAWGEIALKLGGLAVLALIAGLLSTRAFRVYRTTV